MAQFEIDIDLCLKDKRPFKIANASKVKRKCVMASSLDELQWLSKSKLDLKPEAKVSIFLEKDGTEVDDQFFFEKISNHTGFVVKEVPLNGEFVKKQRCKKATRVLKINSFSVQRWKLDDNLLKDKAGLWKSVDSWIFKTKDNISIIENISKRKVLGATSDGKVIQEVFVAGKADQLWKIGEPDAKGYFTLENSGVPKVITAISESSLEGEFVLKKDVKRQQEYANLILFQIKLKDGN